MKKFTWPRIDVMKLLIAWNWIIISAVVLFAQACSSTTSSTNHPVAIAIHGGASNIRKLQLAPEQETAYKDSLSNALETGYNILKNGGSSIEAVEAVIKLLEDCPLFNAGRGSVLTHDGTIEMDAAIMNGESLQAGAVSGIKTVKHPISLARMVMDSSRFVFLSGAGAEQFARKMGLQIMDTSYFFTPFRIRQLQNLLNGDTSATTLADSSGRVSSLEPYEEKYGTVGCVAIDQRGNLAAGTSTGGTVNKQFGRIGDSPLIGCGTYADNATCAVSCTGHGEDFIRNVVAYDIASRIKYAHQSLAEAIGEIIKPKIPQKDLRGGCIAIDRNGNIVMIFNTEGMFRASINTKGERSVLIY